jgi:hypothetical protein
MIGYTDLVNFCTGVLCSLLPLHWGPSAVLCQDLWIFNIEYSLHYVFFIHIALQYLSGIGKIRIEKGVNIFFCWTGFIFPPTPYFLWHFTQEAVQFYLYSAGLIYCSPSGGASSQLLALDLQSLTFLFQSFCELGRMKHFTNLVHWAWQ